jgi:hypothetical protein
LLKAKAGPGRCGGGLVQRPTSRPQFRSAFAPKAAAFLAAEVIRYHRSGSAELKQKKLWKHRRDNMFSLQYLFKF